MLKNFDLKSAGINLFAIWWSLLIFFGYVGYHDYATICFTTPYWPIIAVILGVTVYSYWKSKKIKKYKFFQFRGFQVFGVFQITSMIILGFYCVQTGYGNPNFMEGILYFGVRSSGYMLAILFILFCCFMLGRITNKFLRLNEGAEAIVIHLAIGISLLTFISFVLGSFGLFRNYILWPIILIVLVVQHKKVLTFLKGLIITKHSFKRNSWIINPLIWLILVISAVPWISSLKVFPVGFDGSNLYMNNANILAQSFSLPTGGHAFNWSIFMGIGSSLFNSTTIGILLSHSIGFIALYALFVLIRKWLPLHWALLAVAIVLISPYWSFLSSFDEKVDLGFLFIALSSILLFFTIIKKEDQPKNSKRILAWLALGWLIGFSFGIKYIGIILLIAIIAQIFHHVLGFKGYLLALLSMSGVAFIGGLANFGYIDLSAKHSYFLGTILIASACILYFFPKGKPKFQEILAPVKITLFVLFGFLINFLPWSIKHQVEHDTISSVHLLEGATKFESIPSNRKKSIGSINQSPIKKIHTQETKVIPVSFQEAKIIAPSKSKSGWDEVTRYLGYEDPIWNYFSLPFDLTYNNNIQTTKALDVGFLFLILCPFLFLIFPFSNGYAQIGSFFLLLALTGMGLFAHHFSSSSESIFNSFSGHEFWIKGHSDALNNILNSIYSYLLIPISLFSPLWEFIYNLGRNINVLSTLTIIFALYVSLAFLFKRKFKLWDIDAKGVGMIVGSYTLFWVVTGNGISWYGLLIWALLPSLLIYQLFSLDKKKAHTKFVQHWSVSIVAIYIFMSAFLSFFNSDNREPIKNLFNQPFIEHFTTPRSTEQDVLSRYNVDSYQAIQLINAEPSRNIFMVNTSFLYHIDNNDQRVFQDNQLHFFGNKVIKYNDHKSFISNLRYKDIGFILLDLNTPSLDRTKEKKLIDRFNKFTQILLRSESVQLIATDNYVIDESSPVLTFANGKKLRAKKGLKGKTAAKGSFVLYQIN